MKTLLISDDMEGVSRRDKLENQICEIYTSGIIKKYVASRFDIFKKEEIEDIENDVFTYVFKNIDKLRDEEKLKVWIYKIAKSYALSEKQRKINAKTDFYGDDFYDVVDRNSCTTGIDVVGEEEKRAVLEKAIRDAMKKFPTACRSIMYMRYVDGLKLKEIAEKMDMNYSSVRSIHSRCIKGLSNLLEERGDSLHDFL